MAVETEEEKGTGQEGIWKFVLADVGETGIGHNKGVPKRKCYLRGAGSRSHASSRLA